MTEDEQDKYLEGLVEGIFWPEQWEKSIPGGPVAYDDKMRKERHCWQKGWQHGHRLKLAGISPESILVDPFPHMRK